MLYSNVSGSSAEAHLERLELFVRPSETQLLPPHLPLVEIVVALDALEHAMRSALPALVLRTCFLISLATFFCVLSM